MDHAKKQKKALTHIKSQLADDKENMTIGQAYHLLLTAELLTRGVVISTTTTSAQLEQEVLQNLGKAQLKAAANAKMPAQLMAGSFAVTGMAAEHLSDIILSKCSDASVLHALKLDPSLLKRCQSVKDSMFQAILDLFENVNADDDSLSSSISACGLSALKIARERYLYAASEFMPQQPQMWRKALDIASKSYDIIREDGDNDSQIFSMYPREAILPLKHLVRVVEEKQNMKKLAEFSLFLADSYMSDITIDDDEKKESFNPTIAKKALDRCDFSLLGSNVDGRNLILMFRVVACRVKFAVEDEEISDLATELEQKAMNKSGKVDLSADRVMFMDKARRKIVTSKASGVGSIMYVHAFELRDALFDVLRDGGANDYEDALLEASKPFISLAFDLLALATEKFDFCIEAVPQTARTKVDVSNTPSCSTLASFVLPIIDFFEETSYFSDESNALREKIARSVLYICWVAANSSDVSKRQKQNAIEYIKKANPSFSGTTDVFTGEVNVTAVGKSALLAAVCLTILEDTEDDNFNVHVKEVASMSIKSLPISVLSKLGAPFYQCIVVWSGFFNSKPWPFSTITEARSIKTAASDVIKMSSEQSGKKCSKIDKFILDLAEADAESTLPGGNIHRAYLLYGGVLKDATDLKNGGSGDYDNSILDTFCAYCHKGLGQIALQDHGVVSDQSHGISPFEYIESQGFSAIKLLEDIEGRSNELCSQGGLYISSLPKLRSSLLCSSRQVVAAAYVDSNRLDDALRYLEEAANDRPTDFNANFALASLLLKIFVSGQRIIDAKISQRLLLKTAKIDSNQADPFSLLGIWFEIQKDKKRALGCYSKALALEPCHPVAGRGISRILPSEKASPYFENAVAICSPVNGWAWRMLGSRASSNSDDTLAASCYQQALRSKDINALHRENLSYFYGDPNVSSGQTDLECAQVWADMADCYRRLGKFSASLRAYAFADEASRGRLSATTICAWARVELELGLFDDAYSRFCDILEENGRNLEAIFGLAHACLSLCRNSIVEGKFAKALDFLKKGISIHEEHYFGSDAIRSRSVSAAKCLGDLYSMGSLLPASMFGPDQKSNIASFEAQLHFVAKGEKYYEEAIEIAESAEFDEGIVAAAACDLGANQFMQAQLLCQSAAASDKQKWTRFHFAKKTRILIILDKAVDSFLKAIDVCPKHPAGWCGIGVVMSFSDPLIAQHCFSRALELDKSSPDTWANYAFNCLEFDAKFSCVESLDALTQVADSPLMWIGRALLLESNGTEKAWKRAADAYRTALQVSQSPAALLGLSMTCRKDPIEDVDEQYTNYILSAKGILKVEFNNAIETYLGHKSGYDTGASILGAIAKLEEQSIRRNGSREYLYEEAKNELDSVTGQLTQSSNALPISKDGAKPLRLFGASDEVVSLSEVIDSAEEALVCADIDFQQHSADTLPTESMDAIEKRLHEDPSNGCFWLDYTAALAKEVTVLKARNGNHREIQMIMENAKAAAQTTLSIFHDSVTKPSRIIGRLHSTEEHDEESDNAGVRMQQDVMSEPINASLYAESNVLSSWLDMIDENITEMPSDEQVAIGLQRALMLDPENDLALMLFE